MKAAMMEAV